MLRVGKDYQILVVVRNFWAKGNTETEAFRKLGKLAGTSLRKEKTYQVFLVHPTARVTQEGQISWEAPTDEDFNNRKPILIKCVKNGQAVNPATAE